MQKKMIAGKLNAFTPPATRVKGVTRKSDTSLGWVERQYPQLSSWRVLAVEWLKGETRGIEPRLRSMVVFLERYIVRQGLPLDPAVFLARSTVLPDFFRTVCPDSISGIEYNNFVHQFLQFVLLSKFSEWTENGQRNISPGFHNPVVRQSKSSLLARFESVHSPLPYGYIDELRRMLAAGPNFEDWHWAHTACDTEIGRRGKHRRDWFEVKKNKIDLNDPDCVWRKRSTPDGMRFQMWSPVRWVALLVKLILPLRTFQIRMLDSGEADVWRYEGGSWILNPNRLAKRNKRRPVQQGVFRRSNPISDGEDVSTVLYINTNKTADIGKSGPNKGYVMPWNSGGPQQQDVFYWLEKLRNWQEKYNPISTRTAWRELDSRHIVTKSEMQLAGYPDTCFLFRLPELVENERHLPMPDRQIFTSWFRLLKSLEKMLADRGETHRNGTAIRLLPSLEEQNNGQTTLFPLHSLRVSLITALALDGQVPFPMLQKLVGHSRLLMTLYYTKPGATYIRDMLIGASERMEAAKEASIQNFLLDTSHDELLQQAICHSPRSLSATIPQHPGARNPVGWMPMHHGLCLVGGNTSEAEDNRSVGGCYNGGFLTNSDDGSSSIKYGPVPGGSRNCVRCRWFVTEPHHLPALAAHFNTLAYHFDESRNTCLSLEKELYAIRKQKADAEDAGQPFSRQGAYRQAERIWESAMKRFSDLAEDMVACWRLIERCKAALEGKQGCSTQLVTVGTVNDVHVVFEETESELLQLAVVCDSIEIYPDLQPGKAVLRRSQLLDSVLYREDLPPVFILLSEEEQLLAGNAFMRRLAQQLNPLNPLLGQREVVRLMNSGASLSKHFGMDLNALLQDVRSVKVNPTSPSLTGDSR